MCPLIPPALRSGAGAVPALPEPCSHHGRTGRGACLPLCGVPAVPLNGVSALIFSLPTCRHSRKADKPRETVRGGCVRLEAPIHSCCAGYEASARRSHSSPAVKKNRTQKDPCLSLESIGFTIISASCFTQDIFYFSACTGILCRRASAKSRRPSCCRFVSNRSVEKCATTRHSLASTMRGRMLSNAVLVSFFYFLRFRCGCRSPAP